MANEGGYKRRRLIVNKMQYKLAAVNFLYMFALIMMIVAAIVAPLIITLDDESLASTDRDNAARLLLGLYESTWIAVPLAILLCLFHSVLVSHRIAGPLYRFKQCFQELATGNFALVVRIRRADYLVTEAAVMNEMIEELASKVQSIHASHACTHGTLAQLVQAVEQGDRPEASVLCGKLGTELDDLGHKIRVFRLPADDNVEVPGVAPKPVEAAT